MTLTLLTFQGHIIVQCNEISVNLYAAESPKLTANRDASKPYSYREVEDRKSSEALNMKPVNSSSEPSLSRSKRCSSVCFSCLCCVSVIFTVLVCCSISFV